MRLAIELDREVDGRWIAEIPELNVLLYGRTRSEVDGRWIAEIPELNVLLYGRTRRDAVGKAESAAAEIIADRIAHGELPPEAANAVFAVAA